MSCSELIVAIDELPVETIRWLRNSVMLIADGCDIDVDWKHLAACINRELVATSGHGDSFRVHVHADVMMLFERFPVILASIE